MSAKPISRSAKYRFLVPNCWNDEAFEVTGYVREWDVEMRRDHGSIPTIKLTLEIIDAGMKTGLKARSRGAWDRFVAWLEECPLIRRTETVGRPVI